VTARLRILLVLAVTLLTQLTLATGSAHAYAAVGKPWPRGTITYWSTLPASYSWSTNAAIRAWNTSGARVTFVRARSARSAKLIIRKPPRGAQMEGGGQAQLGYMRGRQAYAWIGGATILQMSNWDMTSRLIAHELGHVVGLHHSDPNPPGCAIMKTYLNLCQQGNPMRDGYWYCRMLFRDDINGAIRLYGRRTRSASTPNYCPVIPAPKALTGMVATGGELNTDVHLSWTNPGLRVGDRVLIEVHGVSCSEPLTNLTRVTYDSVGRKGTGWTDDDASGRYPGPYCYTVQPVNYFGLGGVKRRFERTLTFAPPTVGTLVENPNAEVDYQVPVTFLSDRASLMVRRTASGACATTADQGDEVSSFGDGSGTYSLMELPAGSWCLSFFASGGLAGSPTSTAVTREIAHVD
jgi:hypothetical protein